MCTKGTIAPCNGKVCLMIFVDVMPKEGLAGRAIDYKIILCRFHRLYSVVGVIPKEALAGPCLPIFFGYDTDKDLKARFPVTQLIDNTTYTEAVFMVFEPGVIMNEFIEFLHAFVSSLGFRFTFI